mgnify:CR=1 FL=1
MRFFFATFAMSLILGPFVTGCGPCQIKITHPEGVTSAPALKVYWGTSTATSGTELTSANKSAFLAQVGATGCAPFGIWEGGTFPSGEIATEYEIHSPGRMGVFALAQGVVMELQLPSSSANEPGEVEGV